MGPSGTNPPPIGGSGTNPPPIGTNPPLNPPSAGPYGTNGRRPK